MSVDTLDLSLPSGRQTQVLVGGDEAAKPLVYLHSASGVKENDEFFLKLAESYRTYAIVAPGFNDLAELDELITVHDVALHYDDIFAALDLSGVGVVGHSFGGMFGAELAAHVPARVSELVLISPVGLWNDDHPVADIFAIPPLELGHHMWADPSSEVALKAMGAMTGFDDTSSQDEIVEAAIRIIQGLVTAGKYMMPIPDRGLSRRLYRVTAPTLLIWGREDRIVPCAYAKDFGALLKNSTELIIDGGGHMVTLECMDEVLAAISSHIS